MKKPGSKLRLLFWVVFGLMAILMVVILPVIQLRSYFSRQSWADYERSAEARGEIFSYAKLAPPPAPDDQNFAMTPLLRAAFFSPDHGVVLADQLSLKKSDDDDLPNFGDWALGVRTDLAAWSSYLGQPDILTALKKYDAEMDEISAARHRPLARFPLDYENLGMISEAKVESSCSGQASTKSGSVARRRNTMRSLREMAVMMTL
jgi:hypothetical protein